MLFSHSVILSIIVCCLVLRYMLLLGINFSAFQYLQIFFSLMTLLKVEPSGINEVPHLLY